MTYGQLGVGGMRAPAHLPCPEPHGTLRHLVDAGLVGINRLSQGRLYGLLPYDARVAPRLRDHLTALFGIKEVHVPKHGYRPVPIKVVFSTIQGGNRPPNSKDAYFIKRLGVHEHHLRNRRIVRLAQALAHKDVTLLKAKVPEVAACFNKRVSKRVGILVDNIAQGLALAGKLGWPMVAAENVNDHGLSAEQQTILEAGRNEHYRTKKPVVVTGAGMMHAGRFDVLIRADGGTGLPAIPKNKLRIKNDQDAQMLLLDFADRHHPLLRHWSRLRREAYLAADWMVAGQESTALDKFLATRPEVLG